MEIIMLHKKILATMTALTLFGVGNSEANSSFNSQAALTMSIGTHSSDLLINGLFQGFSDNGTISGDGSVTTIFPNRSPVVTTSGDYKFDSFSAQGNASNGDVFGSIYTGWYSLDFTNQSLSAMTVSLTLNYQLLATASGQFADSNINMDYYMGSDVPVNVAVNASVFDQENATKNSFDTIVFNLNPGSSMTFHSDVTIDGNLSASPVPLPAAAWLFLLGLLVMARRAANYAKTILITNWVRGKYSFVNS
jgi:hypothetical protein